MEGTLEATESRASFSRFTEETPGVRGAGTHTTLPTLMRTHGNEHICQEDVPAQLLGIDLDQRLPRSKEALEVAIAEGGPGVWQLAQEGPAAGGQTLCDEGLGLWLQRADLRDRSM